jgi:hypothetical protein
MSKKTGRKVKQYVLENGDIVTLKEVIAATGLPAKSCYARLKRGKSREHALRPVENVFASQRTSSFQDTYGSMPDNLFKLMFGSWT